MNDVKREAPWRIRRFQTISLGLLVVCGTINAASPLGTAIAPPLLTLLMLTFNWRWMFVAMGVVGLQFGFWSIVIPR